MYTQINCDRLTDYLVIYNGAAGSTTKTNMYGYEILVSAEGLAISASAAGDAAIPEGGFVVSGPWRERHGAAKRLSAAG